MKIELDIGDAINVATALTVYAYRAVEVAEEYNDSRVLVKAADRKFALMNRYREAVELPTLTVDELKEEFRP